MKIGQALSLKLAGVRHGSRQERFGVSTYSKRRLEVVPTGAHPHASVTGGHLPPECSAASPRGTTRVDEG